MNKGKIFLKKVLTGMICICLVSTSIFVEYYEFPLLAAQEEAPVTDVVTPSEGQAPFETEQTEKAGSIESLSTEKDASQENFTIEPVFLETAEDITKDYREITSGESNQAREFHVFDPDVKREEINIDDLSRSYLTSAPSSGIISADTIWLGGTLEGNLTVEQGVTLWITEMVTIKGNVIINGEGTIVREGDKAYFYVESGASLTLDKITLDGNLTASENPMVYVSGEIIMDNQSTIKNCVKSKTGGAALFISEGRAVLNNAVIENCCAECWGGAVYANNSLVTIFDGIYQNNRTTSAGNGDGGGFIANFYSKLYINGGSFIGNNSVSAGGCIYSNGLENSQTYFNGGSFKGNVSSCLGYEGSGAVYFNSGQGGEFTSFLNFSGNTQFLGDGNFGTDGIYLEDKDGIARKIQISSGLNNSIPIFLKASEGRILAEGAANQNSGQMYQITKEDMDQISFFDVNRTGQGWYKAFDKDANQIYLSSAVFHVTYDCNGAETSVTDENEYRNGDDITIQSGEDLFLGGHPFLEWNTKLDGTGYSYSSGSSVTIKDNITLYAIYDENIAFYTVEYYGQSIEGSNYELKESEKLMGIVGVEVRAEEKYFAGFHENTDFADTNATGVVTGDGSLVLKLFYDREVYQVEFDLNGAEGIKPDAQTILYENCVEKVSDPSRIGYQFKGWYTDQEGTEGNIWNFENTVNVNTSSSSVILYAKWADETAPLLGEASFNKGYKNTLNWIIRKKNLIITVPIIEEGSGIKDTLYELTSSLNEGEAKSNELSSGGGIGIVTTKKAQMEEENGQIIAKLVIDEDFKGKVLIKCTDNAGNSSEKTITSSDGGVIVEDNAPEISFSYSAQEESGWFMEPVDVEVTITDSGNNKIAGGISRVEYQIDNGIKTSLIENIFSDSMIYNYIFPVNISGVGEHILSVNAVDHAGNESTAYIRINIKGKDHTYTVEHYKQNITGDGYVLEETESLIGTTGSIVTAAVKSYTGFTENTTHIERKPSALVEEDGIPVLRLYYDRNIYEVNFQLNGAEGNVPAQQIVRYGDFLRETAEPERIGYHFKGWYKDEAGTEENRWYFDRTVEQNTTLQNITLYAKWSDETAPVLGKVSYNKGYKHLSDWIIHNKELILTVPIIEEGSGIKQADYLLVMEDEDISQGTAKIKTEDGQSAAVIFINEDFKGKVTLSCTDNAGNISAEKTITSSDGGVIVEDNAPEIIFTSEKGKLSEWFIGKAFIDVEVIDDEDDNITSGIASVVYQLDEQESVDVTEEDFENDIMETCNFTIDITGLGEHDITVTAIDHAGNKNTEKVTIKIKEKKDSVIYVPNTNMTNNSSDNISNQIQNNTPSAGRNPKTGDSLPIEIYVTMAMIAGFSYLLFYFATSTTGITEEDIRNLVYRLNRWKKDGGRIRKSLVVTAIFFIMIYYYSVGKFAILSWKKVYER